MVDLYRLFFQTSKDDLETARENLNKSRDYISLYHYQQSFEKALKSLHIFEYKRIAENYSDSDA